MPTNPCELVAADVLARARWGASYCRWYARQQGYAVAVFLRKHKVGVAAASSTRARRLMECAPAAFIGVYDASVEHEELVRDLVAALAVRPG